MTERHLLICGLGYAGMAVARRAVAEGGWLVAGTVRDPAAPAPMMTAAAGVTVLPFAGAAAAVAQATHLLVTAAPEAERGDPVLATHGEAVRAAARSLRWIGYLSTTGVYGDRGGAWVDETAAPTPMQDRTRRRVAAEDAWRALAASTGRALDIFRAGGIYGPGRSVLDELRDGTARRTVKPGHAFSRIHRDDIALAVLAAAAQEAEPGRVRVLHLVDDEPAESAVVVEAAAHLLGIPPPPPVRFVDVAAAMSPMARSFWAENRRVANARTRAALGIAWQYPSYREGLRAILEEPAGAAGGAGAAVGSAAARGEQRRERPRQ